MPIDNFNVLIVEDENKLATIQAEFIEKNFNMRVVGIAATLSEAKRLLQLYKPRLILLDNYLPDGEGVSLIESELLKGMNCSVIFITAASDMNTCAQAIRCGAFDYIIKPVSYPRLRSSLERFIQFVKTQHTYKIVDQQNVDVLYQLQASTVPNGPGSKGIEENTLNLIQQIFLNESETLFSVDDVVDKTGLSKTTARRYLEFCVENQFLEIEMRYGKIGHPRRLYRKKNTD
ncbi:response regulator [Pectobacteriaceae bacterium CE70]|uniref:Transcriptional regulatory protein n=1 Tax=Serratia sp. (strain ATCC 39006) TaxID=104623 RepID=A0A2I5T9A5_SERS3|nr:MULTISPECIES: response regulator [Enterobacterales]WJV59923.1 response regulator [Pectobacteriaceae bacterium C111]WJV64261.1 response regulator [Pectobacteriaceae bacterium C52]WJV65308.1 response regulator [Pectobacteriaceae bacterium CE70]WJY09324.1 response regulator [Pectobacteriaceae bacterium C80]WJY13374.1 response regulator [Pectobacteriaceae bacterium CE90]